MLGKNTKFTHIDITGDGSCSCYPMAVALCTAVLADRLPYDIRTQKSYEQFFEKFGDFHPNFRPTTLENFKLWIQTYAKTTRDMELLVGPVLRYWYEQEIQKLPKATGLRRLVVNRAEHLGDEVSTWLCKRLGFNLKFTDTVENFSWTSIDDQRGPMLHVLHGIEHFNVELENAFASHIQKGESFILERHRNVDNAWNYEHAPLEAPVVNVITDNNDNEHQIENDFKIAQEYMQKEMQSQRDHELARKLAIEAQPDVHLQRTLSSNISNKSEDEVVMQLRDKFNESHVNYISEVLNSPTFLAETELLVGDKARIPHLMARAWSRYKIGGESAQIIDRVENNILKKMKH